MIRQISISNFKSIQSLDLDVGRFNVIVGANGSGKSNVLEAVAWAGAASAKQLEDRLMRARGIRVSEPAFMKSAFDVDQNQAKGVSLQIQLENGNQAKFYLEHREKEGWRDEISSDFYLQQILDGVATPNVKETIEAKKNIEAFLNQFVIYSPENSSLRNFHSEYQIEPLGVHGEGLFALLSDYFAHQENGKWQELNDALSLFSWFDSFEVSTYGADARQMAVKDFFVDEEVGEFEHRCVNEGFLFVLFYVALFISDKTSSCFAIDNIEAALNPKLARELVQQLYRLAQKYDKQVFISTHSPIILDALDLSDEEQRLLVVSRNLEGQTNAKRIKALETAGAPSPSLPLSEAFMRGYLGGLPDNF
ncbi:MAG: AAA family ATPase [Bacteroidota bacterium]